MLEARRHVVEANRHVLEAKHRVELMVLHNAVTNAVGVLALQTSNVLLVLKWSSIISTDAAPAALPLLKLDTLTAVSTPAGDAFSNRF
jgi:hypothetical protein